ncbi:MAG: TetR/AcrR family transcriptional regulator [Acidimicrobiia bacterium]
MPRIRASTIEEHKVLNRREILDAAAELFSIQGYSATSFADIAGLVGIGRTTLYEYFVDKEDILVNLVEENLPEVLDEIVGALPEGLGSRQRLGELVVRGLEFVSDETNVGAVLMREVPKLSAEAQERVEAAHNRLADEVTRVCAQGIASGEFRNFLPEEVGRIIYALIMAESQELIRSDEPKQKVHDVAETLLRFIFDGLLT